MEAKRSRHGLAALKIRLREHARSSASLISNTANWRLTASPDGSTISSARAKIPGWLGTSSNPKLDSQRNHRDHVISIHHSKERASRASAAIAKKPALREKTYLGSPKKITAIYSLGGVTSAPIFDF